MLTILTDVSASTDACDDTMDNILMDTKPITIEYDVHDALVELHIIKPVEAMNI